MRKKKQIKKDNPYVYFTIIFAIVVVLLIAYDVYENKIKTYNIDGVVISKADLCNFYKVTGMNRTLQLCDLDNKICSRKITLMNDPCK